MTGSSNYPGVQSDSEEPYVRPFFTYYGGKWRIANRYPAPRHDLIVEPFAGSAGYALRHGAGHEVHLYDLDEKIVGTWDYLIHTSAEEIRRLPLFDGTWETVDDLDLPQEARWVVGWWLNKGATSPAKRPSAWLRGATSPGDGWGPVIRERLASQVEGIRRWSVTRASYADIDLQMATYFVDPPYIGAGKHYRMSASGIDFAHLGEWCRSLPGLAIVCENVGADWLPFEPFVMAKANESKTGGKRSAEAIWTSDFATSTFSTEAPA